MNLTDFQKEVLVGSILGDAGLYKTSWGPNSNAYFSQGFSFKFEEFALNIQSIFSDYMTLNGYYSYQVNSVAKSLVTEETTSFKKIIVRTKASPLFTEYHKLFYKENPNTEGKRLKGRYTKIIPLNIAEHFTKVSLAYLIMGDGSFNKRNQFITIALNNFTKIEVELLSQVMLDKFGFNCRLDLVRDGQYSLVIRRSDLPQIQGLIQDLVIPSMAYKLGL